MNEDLSKSRKSTQDNKSGARISSLGTAGGMSEQHMPPRRLKAHTAERAGVFLLLIASLTGLIAGVAALAGYAHVRGLLGFAIPLVVLGTAITFISMAVQWFLERREITRAAKSWRGYFISRLGEAKANDAITETVFWLRSYRDRFGFGYDEQDSWHAEAGVVAGKLVLRHFDVNPPLDKVSDLLPSPGEVARAWSVFAGDNGGDSSI